MRNALLIAVILPLWATTSSGSSPGSWILTPNGFLNWLVELARARLLAGRPLELGDLDHVGPTSGSRSRCCRSTPRSSGYRHRSWRRRATWVRGAGSTFRRVVFPLALPGTVAGSIFSFSLTLGDYIVPELVGNTQFIGNVIYDNVGGGGERPTRSGVRTRPDRGDGRVPAARETGRRVRGALTMESRLAGSGSRRGPLLTLLFLYVPLVDRRDLRVQRSDRSGMADPGLHAEVVRHRVPRGPRCATRWWASLQIALFTTVARVDPGERGRVRRAPVPILRAEHASPSSSCCRSHCRDSATAIALRSAINHVRHPLGVLDDVIGARDLLHRGRVQQRPRSAATNPRRSLIEASMDLGADGWQTFRYVTFPAIRTAVLAGGLLAFALSFDEIVVTNFTGGQHEDQSRDSSTTASTCRGIDRW